MPQHPGQLVIPPGTTAAMTATMTAHHTEQLRLFREVNSVEKALLQQLVQVLDPTYIAEFRYRVTRQITGPLHTVHSIYAIVLWLCSTGPLTSFDYFNVNSQTLTLLLLELTFSS